VNYVVKIALTQKDGNEVTRDSRVTIPDQKVNGCKVEAETRTIDNSGDNFNIDGSAGAATAGSSTPPTVLGLGAVVVLLASALAYVLWRNRRPHRKELS